jgi:hypothetical protein
MDLSQSYPRVGVLEYRKPKTSNSFPFSKTFLLFLSGNIEKEFENHGAILSEIPLFSRRIHCLKDQKQGLARIGVQDVLLFRQQFDVALQ